MTRYFISNNARVTSDLILGKHGFDRAPNPIRIRVKRFPDNLI